MPEHIEVQTKDKVCWITLNRPEARNAIGVNIMSVELEQALRDAAENDDVRVIVIGANGPVFCAGGDVKEMAAQFTGGNAVGPAKVRAIIQKFHRMMNTLYDVEKPIIAALQGPAVGAGCSLALACDVRIGTQDASFTFAFVHRGLSSDGGTTFLLPSLVGYAKAYELLTLGDKISADEAMRIGLINQVVPADQLEQTVAETAARYAAAPPKAIATIKRSLRLAASATLQDALEMEATLQTVCVLGEEHAEGVRAFLEKRLPKF